VPHSVHDGTARPETRVQFEGEAVLWIETPRCSTVRQRVHAGLTVVNKTVEGIARSLEGVMETDHLIAYGRVGLLGRIDLSRLNAQRFLTRQR
jgi:hypothetical protein